VYPNKNEKLPKISCCLCTYDRFELCHRSIQCFLSQIYNNKELVIVCEGPAKHQIAEYVKDMDNVKFFPLDKQCTLGEVRNYSIEKATGDIVVQWDDDDLSTASRLAAQLAILLKTGSFACFLSEQLHYYWDTKELFWEKWNYKGLDRYDWIPGTIMMYKNDIYKYPETGSHAKAGEDVILVNQLWHDYVYNGLKIAKASNLGHMQVYTFHGSQHKHSNTFDMQHHRWLSINNSLSIADILDHQELICSSLNQLKLGDEINVMGKEGLAFIWKLTQ